VDVGFSLGLVVAALLALWGKISLLGGVFGRRSTTVLVLPLAPLPTPLTVGHPTDVVFTVPTPRLLPPLAPPNHAPKPAAPGKRMGGVVKSQGVLGFRLMGSFSSCHLFTAVLAFVP